MAWNIGAAQQSGWDIGAAQTPDTPLTYTRTVGTASRDYSTFALAEADIATIATGTTADLVTNNEAIVFDVYNDSVFSIFNITFDSGGTFDATRNVTWRAASGEEHDGTFGTGARGTWGGGGNQLVLEDDHTVFERLSFERTSTGGGSLVILGIGSGNCHGVQMRGCILRKAGATSAGRVVGIYGNQDMGTTDDPIVFENCLLDSADYGVWINVNNTANAIDWNVDFVNCTFANQGTYGLYVRLFGASQEAFVRCVNVLGIGAGTADYEPLPGSSTITTTGSTNNVGEYSGTGEWPGGEASNPYTSTTLTNPGVGTWIIYTSSSDYSLVDDADNDALNTGVGPSSNALVPTIDCVGETRSGTTTDPGAFQVPASSGVTGTSALTLPSLTMSALGEVDTSGTSALTLPSLTMAATGVVIVTGSSALTLPALTMASSGTVGGGPVTGTSAMTLPSLTMTATGEIIVTGTADDTDVMSLPRLTMTASGQVIISGTSGMTLPALTMAASGYLRPEGSSALTLPALTMTASGSVGDAVGGTSFLTLPSLTSTASGEVSVPGTSSMTLPALTMASSGYLLPEGTSALTLPSLTMASSGWTTVTGTAALTLPSLTMTSSGTAPVVLTRARVVRVPRPGVTVDDMMRQVPDVTSSTDPRRVNRAIRTLREQVRRLSRGRDINGGRP